MNTIRAKAVGILLALAAATPAAAYVQFPYDICYTAAGAPCPAGAAFPTAAGTTVIVDWNNNGVNDAPPNIPLTNVPAYKSLHLGASDGFIKMADGTDGMDGTTIRPTDMYTFGFSDQSRIPAPQVIGNTMNRVDFPGPTIDVTEGQEFYLTLTNAGMPMRPDLFDPHTVHFHGFPNAAPVFDGEPMSSVGINMMFDLTYYYNIPGPIFVDQIPPIDPAQGMYDAGISGTYMYHCHVEAPEHMEMGMLANAVVRPTGYDPNIPATWRAYNNDLFGGVNLSTYNVEAIIQFSAFDPAFHMADLMVQPLPFANFDGRYFLLNGRGYPDTVNYKDLQKSLAGGDARPELQNDGDLMGNPYWAQKHDALITASVGQRILVRLSNLSIEGFTTMEFMGLPVQVVGKCAKMLINAGFDGIFGTADDRDLTYYANSVLIGPGETFDVIINTAGVPPGTYYMYARNLNHLNSNQMERSGAMTEIRIQ